MRLRVVCGFEVTIATFCPTRRFNSVDFPAFGRPTMATNPDRYFSLCPLRASALPPFSLVSATSRLPAWCFFFGIRLLHHRQFQQALVFGIMKQSDVGCLGILRGFLRDDTSTVVIFFHAERIGAVHKQPQTASFGDAPGKKCKILEDVFFCLSHGDEFFLSQGLPIT